MDAQYLNAIGWRGIRQRKVHMEELLQLAMAELKQAGRPVRILDIAAGHGRYVLEALTQGEPPESIVLRDYSPSTKPLAVPLFRPRGWARSPALI